MKYMETNDKILRTSLMFENDVELNNLLKDIIKDYKEKTNNIILKECLVSLPNIFNEPAGILNKDSQHIFSFEELHYMYNYENVILNDHAIINDDIKNYKILKNNASFSFKGIINLYNAVAENNKVEGFVLNFIKHAFDNPFNFFIYALEMGLRVDISDEFILKHKQELSEQLIQTNPNDAPRFISSDLQRFLRVIVEIGFICKLLHDKYCIGYRNKLTKEIKTNALKDIKKYFAYDIEIDPIQLNNYGNAHIYKSMFKFEGLSCIDPILDLIVVKDEMPSQENKEKVEKDSLPVC